MATLNLGRIKPVFRGAYAGGTAYVIDDIVTSGGETFICIQASTGNATSSASHWTKLAEKGLDGTNVATTITTQGDILYRDGSGLARLGAGTSGQFLKTQGTGANPVWADTGGRTVQMKALYFDDQIDYGSNSWGNHSHPLGDGTIQITPKATGNLIRVEMNTNNTGGDTWQSTMYRYQVSTDSGSNWSYVTSSSDGVAGGHEIYNQGQTVTTATHNTFWHIAQNTNLHMFKVQAYGRSGGGGDKINYDAQGGNTERSRLVITEIDMTGSDFTSGAL
jgi:hypothetical protein